MEKFESEFWSDLQSKLEDPHFEDEFNRELAKIRMVDQIINQLDSIREAQGMSKAQLARKLSAEPANLRRLFSAESPNPTAGTVAEIALALGYKLTLSPISKPKSGTKPPTSIRQSA
ncbi:MAG: hypothetical protein RL174_749 [Actinomycetota bacterium]|jgi:DNA-binding phage protein